MDYRKAARQAAAKYGLNPTVFLRQINQESGFNPEARSSAGAVGIAQIVPKYHPGVDPTDPLASLDYAAKWMSSLVKQYGGSYEKALSVYNSGRPDAYLDQNFANGQTYNYVRSILRGAKIGGGATVTSAPLPQAGKTQATPTTQSVTPDKQTMDYQALARSYRAQAIAGLGDIASGQQKATDVFAQTAESMKTLAAPPALTKMVSSMPVVMHDANDPLESQAAKLVQKYLGVNYVWGGSTPKGFDCSGLVQYVYHSLGRAIPRTTYDQWDAGKPVQGDLRPGDAVFFTGSDPANGKPGHEGLYIGGGKFIEAPHTGAVVRISTLADRKDYVGARRFA